MPSTPAERGSKDTWDGPREQTPTRSPCPTTPALHGTVEWQRQEECPRGHSRGWWVLGVVTTREGAVLGRC